MPSKRRPAAEQQSAVAKLPEGSKAPQANPAFPTVGIGASAGGLPALQSLFQDLPNDTGAAFVVIIHLDPDHRSDLAPILAARTTMPVLQVSQKIALEPNKVYVIPPNRRLLISDHDIATFAFDEPRGQRAPIDQFFRSLADQHGDGFAIVLSGAGSDGAVGVKAIKEGGGIILVQDPAEAEYPSMPRAAIATGLADFVLPVAGMASQLTELIQSKKHVPPPELGDGEEETFRRIMAHLRTRTGHDFALYKRSTVFRRLARRMQVTKVTKLEDYYALLRGNAEEAQNLFADLLISVTTFFRDAGAFEALAREVIPKLFEVEDGEGSLRVWVAGCATGEEAYSIGMLLIEEASRREVKPTIQIFGTDLDAGALATAREGRYPSSIAADVSEDRLRRFFVKEGDHYRVRRELRDLVLFASHSLLKDPPFSKLNLISCRNLLIYLDRDLQQQVCQTFQYALLPQGYLFLGSSETAEHPPGLFRTLNRDARIYQSTRHAGDRSHHLPRLTITPRLFDTPVTPPTPVTPAHRVQVHAKALEELGPPSVIVDRSFHVINMSETAGRYMQPAGGPPSFDITELARPELRFELRSLLHKAFEKNQGDISLVIPVQFNGHPVRVQVMVRPLKPSNDVIEQAIVFFLEGGPVSDFEPSSQKGDVDRENGQQIQVLREELEITRSKLRTSGEEFEAATEELRAANEELQSINEEYRSTAEELETSKEELQSINEELQTVNSELKVKLEGVSRVNSDLQNLMSATDVGTLFLDTHLCIKRFTPPIAGLFNFTATDEGRSITDFTHRLDYPDFAEEARKVIKDLLPIEREVPSNGKWYLTRLRPYRTVDDKIDGVVATFVDVTLRRQAEEEVRTSAARLRLLMQELSHRVKNTLAVVQSIARLSFRDDPASHEGLQNFIGRIAALSEAHEILIHNDWVGAELSELVRRQLSPHQTDDKITISGPRVILPPELATPFALVLHELVTNALKYGALSSPEGTLSLSWTLNNDKDRLLTVNWHEEGVHLKEAPHRSGFGTYLLERGLPGAEV